MMRKDERKCKNIKQEHNSKKKDCSFIALIRLDLLVLFGSLFLSFLTYAILVQYEPAYEPKQGVIQESVRGFCYCAAAAPLATSYYNLLRFRCVAWGERILAGLLRPTGIVPLYFQALTISASY